VCVCVCVFEVCDSSDRCIVVVVFLADTDPERRDKVARGLCVCVCVCVLCVCACVCVCVFVCVWA
jgi:hypothetical protein